MTEDDLRKLNFRIKSDDMTREWLSRMVMDDKETSHEFVSIANAFYHILADNPERSGEIFAAAKKLFSQFHSGRK